jgi:hypothetical protein
MAATSAAKLVSNKMVDWPAGLPSNEVIADAKGTPSVTARNMRSFVVVTDMSGAGTLSLATTFTELDGNKETRTIKRREGAELFLSLIGDNVHVLTLGTGFGTIASVSSTTAIVIHRFVLINGLFEKA